MKVYVVGGNDFYASWIENCELCDSVEDADVVFFTGGEDVSPELYQAKKHPTTYSNVARDVEEVKIFNQVKPSQLVLGVCRGSQFVCVMNGGKLVQNCDNHALYGVHSIKNKEGEKYAITSTHHQMQYPYNLNPKDYDVLYTASDNLSTYYQGDLINTSKILKHGEPEIVLYHSEGLPKCLAIQGHPEMMLPSALHTMLNNLIINNL